MADYVPLIIIGALAYWEFVLRGGQDLNNLIPQASAAAAPAASTTTGGTAATTPCQGKDKNGQPCTCTAPTTASAVVFAYATKKKKSSSSSKSKSSSSGSGDTTQTKTQVNGCDCSVCQGTSAAPTSNNLNDLGTKIQNDIKHSSAWSNVGMDLNAYVGASLANEGYGFDYVNGYRRRNW